ncbi:hypothetical protein [Mesobacillus subterraneus]|uniref:Uncharacterized protein n=1 Tax=Mesobacillus subterraneus TaxID=285983 RepID=A0A3R9DUG1_9BACI|nr:hypothetical protein [Mesobacillus subterraneus]RSD27570.1 hypothetical protein EJA10_09385 [Mesobacillus subterraneus]
MSFNFGSNVLLFLAAMLAGWALIKFGPGLLTLATLGLFEIIGVLVIVIFAIVIIFIALRVLFNGGWR